MSSVPACPTCSSLPPLMTRTSSLPTTRLPIQIPIPTSHSHGLVITTLLQASQIPCSGCLHNESHDQPLNNPEMPTGGGLAVSTPTLVPSTKQVKEHVQPSPPILDVCPVLDVCVSITPSQNPKREPLQFLHQHIANRSPHPPSRTHGPTSTRHPHNHHHHHQYHQRPSPSHRHLQPAGLHVHQILPSSFPPSTTDPSIIITVHPHCRIPPASPQ